MSVSLSSRPSITDSNWSACKNPVVYILYREDNTIVSADNSGGFLRLTVTGNVTANYLDGDSLVLNDASNTIYYRVAVTGNSTLSGGDTLIVTDIAFTTTTDTDVTNGTIQRISALTNHRVEYEVFNADTNISLTEGVTFTASADAYGKIIINVSPIILASLSPVWESITDPNKSDTYAHIPFYIKYTEKYTGSAVGQVDDVSNPMNGVFAAMQIYHMEKVYAYGSNMKDYVPKENEDKLWLTRFYSDEDNNKVTYWAGYPFSLSFIYPSGLPLISATVEQYDASGTFILSAATQLDSSYENYVNRLNFLDFITLNARAKSLVVRLSTLSSELVSNPTFTATLSPWVNIAGAGPDWSYDSDKAKVTLTNVASDVLRQDFSQQDAGMYRLGYTVTRDAAVVIEYRFIDNVPLAGTVVFNSAYTSAAGAGIDTFALYLPIAAEGFDRLEIRATNQAGGTNVILIDSVSIKKLNPVIIPLDISVETELCDNPVYLYWKNSLGGDSFYLFQHSQEYSFTYSNGRKVKRMKLFADNIEYVEWTAINELNSVKERYEPGIQELTTSNRYTARQDGNQVYILSGTDQIGVIVIPSSSVISNKDTTHSIQIDIELPEVFE